MEKKIFIKTFGCQMNVYDSNRIYDSVKKIGFKKTNDQKNADCFVLNTCHIRDKAKGIVDKEDRKDKKTEFTIIYARTMSGPYISYDGVHGE